MGIVYSRQLFWGYMDPGFAAYSPGPVGEVWIIRDLLLQFQGPLALADVALTDGTNWGSLVFETQSGPSLDFNIHGMNVVWEEGQALVGSVIDYSVAVLLSGYKLQLP